MGRYYDVDRGLVQDERSARYLTAQICINGHRITDSIEISPELMADFCSTCGAATVRACPNCNAPIRGFYDVPGVVVLADNYETPNHCHACGKAFPWTNAKLEAAKEHALELEGLDEGEKQLVQTTLDDLAADGPRTELAASRFKRLMRKAGQTAGSGLYKVAIDLASEAARKALLGRARSPGSPTLSWSVFIVAPIHPSRQALCTEHLQA